MSFKNDIFAGWKINWKRKSDNRVLGSIVLDSYNGAIVISPTSK